MRKGQTMPTDWDVHGSDEAAFAAVPTPTTLDEVGPAQIAVMAIYSARGSYGCEHHTYVAAMRRVSAILFARPCADAVS